MQNAITLSFTAEDCAEGVRRHATNELFSLLAQGLWLMKAHSLFARPVNDRGQGRKSSATVALDFPDGAEAPGFDAWLSENARWISRRTAFRYIAAARNVGLTVEDDDTAIERLRNDASLEGKRLTDLAKVGYQKTLPAPEAEREAPKEPAEQLLFEFEEELNRWFAPGQRRRDALAEMPLPAVKKVEEDLRSALAVVREIRQAKEEGLRGGQAA